MKIRSDINVIADLVEPNSKVLDIGCGEGEMLLTLMERKQIKGRGLEIDPQKVSICMKKGLSVMQGDADIDLAHYPSNAFDYAILTQTLQVTKHPEKILTDMLRVATQIIVSIPNFGYWENRTQILFSGRMPVTSKLSYQWYETPNIHFCTIRDFIVLCEELEIKVEKRLAITASNKILEFTGKSRRANIFGEQGVFLLSK